MLGIGPWSFCVWMCFWVVSMSGSPCTQRGDSKYLLINCSESENLPSFPSGRYRRVDLVGVKLDRAPGNYFLEIDTVHLRLFGFEAMFSFEPKTKGGLRILEIYDSTTAFSWKFTHPSLAGLTHLVLDNVNLYLLSEDPNQLASLRFLEVRDSSVRWIHPRGFSNLKELRMLCLSGNVLREFRSEYLPRPAAHLWHLDLSFNRIQSLPSDLFGDTPELRELKLDHNRLKYIEDRIRRLPSLRELWTQDNPACQNCDRECSCFSLFPHQRLLP